MRPTIFGRFLAASLILAGASAAMAQRVGLPWWKDEKVVRELGLSSEQSARIDTIFRATIGQLRQSKEELDRQEAELSRLIMVNADEVVVGRQIDKVESVRASLNKARTMMLLHMVRKLTPEQRAKFTPVHEQWRRDHPPAPPDTRPTEPVKSPDIKGRPPGR